MRHNPWGFSILELMLVVALVAVVGAIAVPAYQGVVDRSNASRAVADIGALSLQLYRSQTNTGAFPPDLATAGLDGRRDPWGRPYVYLELSGARRDQVRRDKNLVPINTDFDLYSVGKDGATTTALTARASRDDIIRANNGGYIGRAEDY
jgi:general secretion pathway protein G